MTGSQEALGIDELAARADVPVRTVRYYVTERLLPGPEGRGKAAIYGDQHVLRLQLIRRLVERRVPLSEIRGRLAGLELEEMRSLLSEEERRSQALARTERAASPRAYVSSLLSRARSSRPSSADRASRFAAESTAVREEQAAPDTWHRIELAPGLELHVRVDVERAQRALVGRIREIAAAARPTRAASRGRATTEQRGSSR